MPDAVLYSLAAAVLVVLLALAQRWQKKDRTPFSLVLARGLRRLGRWFWAVGEGLEFGYFHSQRVRREIKLDLEQQP
jgi:hypothetical protein